MNSSSDQCLPEGTTTGHATVCRTTGAIFRQVQYRLKVLRKTGFARVI